VRLIGRAIDRLGAIGAALAAVAVLVMVLLMGAGVFFRYVIGQPLIWVDEAVRYVLVFSVMLAVADVMRRGENIRVDLLLEPLPPRLRRVAELGGLLAALVFGLALTWLGIDMVVFSYEVGLTTASEIDIPSAWVEIALPIGGLMLTLATAVRLLRVCRGEKVADPAATGVHGAARE
jgi:TRAP-type C4-dicarboxylate transport system permease small subunit